MNEVEEKINSEIQKSDRVKVSCFQNKLSSRETSVVVKIMDNIKMEGLKYSKKSA